MKRIAVTRSFGTPVTSWQPMREAIASYARRAAENAPVRAAENIIVVIHTNTFNNVLLERCLGQVAETTNDTGEGRSDRVFGRTALGDGFRCSKCSMMLTKLLPETIR